MNVKQVVCILSFVMATHGFVAEVRIEHGKVSLDGLNTPPQRQNQKTLL